jgi:hypothetical protein
MRKKLLLDIRGKDSELHIFHCSDSELLCAKGGKKMHTYALELQVAVFYQPVINYDTLLVTSGRSVALGLTQPLTEMRWFVCFLAQQPPVGQGLLIHEVLRSHTMTHHSR